MLTRLMPFAAVAACLLLAGCGDSGAPEKVMQDEGPKKSLARQVQFYQGQENVQAIQSAAVKPVAGGGYDLEAKVTTDGAGWTKVGFLPRVYAATPPDGIYEVDVVADKPATPGAPGATSVEVKSAWDRYKDGRVKGVKFISKTNEVVAMVAPAG
jgi:hypothetical protein